MRELETQIRELINTPRTRYQLMQDTANWYQLCSSLDVIGDTTLAIDAYLNGEIGAANSDHAVGTTYLLVYGLLQVLIVQQDAVSHLHHALEGVMHIPMPAVPLENAYTSFSQSVPE